MRTLHRTSLYLMLIMCPANAVLAFTNDNMSSMCGWLVATLLTFSKLYQHPEKQDG